MSEQTRARVEFATPAETARRVRSELKAQWPGVKFSVRTEHYSTIYVRWVDGPRANDVEALLAKYQHGYFDGMDDSYHYTGGNVVDGVDFSVQYLFAERAMSDETRARFRALVALCFDELATSRGDDVEVLAWREFCRWDGLKEPLPEIVDELPSRQQLIAEVNGFVAGGGAS